MEADAGLMSIDEVTVSIHQTDADFCSIRDALLAQPPGKNLRLMVDGGRYDEGCLDLREGVCIQAMQGCDPASSRPVVICSGSRELEGEGGPCFRSQVAGARIVGLKIEHSGSNSAACVEVDAGDLFMDGCLVTGCARIGVLISGSSCPIIQNCKVEHVNGDGIMVSDTAAPRVLNCDIHDNSGFGIYCTGSSAGEFADCNIYANWNAGVKTCGTTSGIFRGNKVHSSQQGGFWIEESSVCELVGNEIFQNQKSGIQVGGKADPKVVKNIIRDGFKGGIVVHDRARGSFFQVKVPSIPFSLLATAPIPSPPTRSPHLFRVCLNLLPLTRF
jgi:parallel beta-helix repeat protein